MNLNKLNEEKVALAAQEKNNFYQIPKYIPRDIFRAYDIRGPVDEQHITIDIAYTIGLAVGAEGKKRGERNFIIGRDARLSGPELHKALCAGLLASGCDIVDIGIVPTPVLYFATHRYDVHSGVMITASHNPGHHNGFKVVLKGKTLSTTEISDLYQRIIQQDFVQGVGHQSAMACVIDDYIKYISQQISLPRPLKIVVDAGNGVTGCVAPALYRALGCEVTELYCELDGHFPNHHPDPLVPENLIDIIAAIKTQGADIGLAFDGDGDRLGIVTNKGEIIWPDRQLMLFAKDVLAKKPGAKIIFDVKCSRFLLQVIEQAGGIGIMWQTGHSIIKNKMLEEGAILAGEMSGHIFFKDEWFGFDDGLYVGARLLQIIASQNKSASAIFAELPNSINTPELKIAMTDDKKSAFMANLLKNAQFADGKIITLDGLRVDFDYGWGLVRPSNTSPYLTLRFEADTLDNLKKIEEMFRTQLLAIDASLTLPF